MPHIGLGNDLLGIVGLMRFRPETGGRSVRWPRPCSGTHAPRCPPARTWPCWKYARTMVADRAVARRP
jgi:hypothetical protein